MLTKAEEAIVLEFRHRTLLSLDDVLGSLRRETVFSERRMRIPKKAV